MNSSTNRLLEGNIGKELVRLAFPLLLGNILQQGYHIADSLIIGHYLGVEAFAAAGVAGTVMNLMIFALHGFCTGLSVIFAALYGGGEKKKFRQEVFAALTAGSLLTAGISLLFLGGTDLLLQLIGTPEELLNNAAVYLRIIAAGMIAVYLCQLFSAVLRAVGNTTAGLWFLLLSVGANVGLDWWFVAHLDWGISGVAFATVLAQGIAAAASYGYLYLRYRELWCTRQDMGIHQELLKKTFRFGFASALQESNLYLGKMLVQGAVNRLGTSGIAAYTAALRLEGFANSFGDSGAFAMSVMIAQNYGAGNQQRVQKGFLRGMQGLTVLGILVPFFLFLTAEPGCRQFFNAGDTAALRESCVYLRIVCGFYLLCFLGSGLVGLFRGIGLVHVPVVGTTLNIGTRVLLAGTMTRRWGLGGLGIATGLGWIVVVGYHCWNLRKLKQHPFTSQQKTG